MIDLDENHKVKFISIDEEHCISTLRNIIMEKYSCPNCSSKICYYKKDKDQFECKKCKKRSTLKANTLMFHTRLPIRYWILALEEILLKTFYEQKVNYCSIQRNVFNIKNMSLSTI